MTNLVAVVITFLSTNSFNTRYFDELDKVDIWCEVFSNKAIVVNYEKQWFTNVVEKINIYNFKATRTNVKQPPVYKWETNAFSNGEVNPSMIYYVTNK